MKINIQLFGGRGAKSSLTSIDRILKETAVINPNFSTGGKQYRENCQSCTLAFILREKGENVVAMGGTGKSWQDGNGKKISITEMFNNNPEQKYFIVGSKRFDSQISARNYAMNSKYSNIYQVKANKNSIFTNSYEAIESEVKAWGNNGSGFITVNWKGNKGSHVFNLKNVKGKLVAIDTQSNRIRNLRDTLNQVKPQFTHITRTDNLSVNKRLKKYMVREV